MANAALMSRSFRLRGLDIAMTIFSSFKNGAKYSS
jgi:hypothetical protein